MDEGKSFNITQAEWDLVKQQNYDLKREVNRLTLLEKEYLSDIEVLQSKDGSGRKNLENTIHNLELELHNLKFGNNKRVEQLQNDLVSKDDEIKKLTEELQAVTKSNVNTSNTVEIGVLNERINDLESKNDGLLEINDLLRAEIQTLQNTVDICEEKIKNLIEECGMLSDNYECKKQQLEELKAHVEITQDELFCVKSELDLLRSKPLESNSQGNSLFAEVDDKRVQLQTKLNKMAGHYEEMKRRIVQLDIQLVSLKHENLTLCNKWQKEIEDRANDKYDIEDNYQKRIATLEKLIKDYELELSQRPIVSTKALKVEELDFIEFKIKSKNEEIERHMRSVNDYSLSNMVMRGQKNEIEKEARMWNLKSIRLQHELDDLKALVKDLQKKLDDKPKEIKEIVPCLKPEPIIKSVLKNSNTISISDIKSDGEASKENRNVGFSDDSKSADGTIKFTRAAKVYVCQPMKLKKKGEGDSVDARTKSDLKSSISISDHIKTGSTACQPAKLNKKEF